MVTSRSTAKNQGLVVLSEESSYAGLEATASQRNAKGVYFERGPHERETYIERWLRRCDGDEDIAGVTLLVAPPCPGPADVCPCDDEMCDAGAEAGSGDEYDEDDDDDEMDDDDDDDDEPTIAGPEDIREACEELVAALPSSFRESVRRDAVSLAEMCVRQCPKAPWLNLSLEIQQHDACSRWHQDAVVGRAIVCYTGPGTCTADDSSVRWDAITKPGCNKSCVNPAGMKQMSTNAVLLMKGDRWPSIEGSGLTHRSPDVEADPPKRLLLKVNLMEGLKNPTHIF